MSTQEQLNLACPTSQDELACRHQRWCCLHNNLCAYVRLVLPRRKQADPITDCRQKRVQRTGNSSSDESAKILFLVPQYHIGFADTFTEYYNVYTESLHSTFQRRYVYRCVNCGDISFFPQEKKFPTPLAELGGWGVKFNVARA